MQIITAKTFCATLVAYAFFVSACSDTSSTSVTVGNNVPKAQANVSQNSIAFSNSEISSAARTPVPYGEKPPDSTKILSDRSQLITNYDGYGNMLEKRIFPDHRKLSSVTAMTAADGRIEIVVYGHNGERMVLPESFYEKALTENADSIAQVAEITTERQVKPRIVVSAPKVAPVPTASPSNTETNDTRSEKTETTAPSKSEPEKSQLVQN